MTTTNDIFTAAAASDGVEVRRRGIGFIDGSIPGYALLMGNDSSVVAPLLKGLTQRKILVFIVDEALAADLERTGQSLGWDSGMVSLGLLEALGFITKVAQTFGDAANPDEVLDYARQRLRGFTLLLGDPTPGRLEKAQAALLLGCPVLSAAELPLAEIVQLGIEECGMQIQMPMPDLPVAYSPDFSGQAVSDEICGACLSGVELVVTGEDVVDGRITIIGPDLEAAADDDQPYAMLVEVSGKEMQPDFEPVLERQIETILNDMDGIIHRGQRTLVTLRVHQKSIKLGLRLYHLAEALHARLHNDFGNILSRVQITITTEPSQIDVIRESARGVYQQRDERLSRLSDEDVDTFYTCNLCQTIAAGHLCVISPEHPGVCGAVDWIDARAAVSIRPIGHNKTILKEGLIDANLGQWQSVNRIVAQESRGALEAYSLYSLMQDPGSACGDFECITAMLPLSNGVMVMSHDYAGMTPSGMDWAMLHEMVGAGMPVPGFLGHSKRALQRDKFIAAEGGWRRIVWMNYSLREELRPMLESLAADADVSGFVDMIATEKNTLTEADILAHVESVRHPALLLGPMI